MAAQWPGETCFVLLCIYNIFPSVLSLMLTYLMCWKCEQTNTKFLNLKEYGRTRLIFGMYFIKGISNVSLRAFPGISLIFPLYYSKILFCLTFLLPPPTVKIVKPLTHPSLPDHLFRHHRHLSRSGHHIQKAFHHRITSPLVSNHLHQFWPVPVTSTTSSKHPLSLSLSLSSSPSLSFQN